VFDFVRPFFGSACSFHLFQCALVVTGGDFNMEARQRRFAAPENRNIHGTAKETTLFRNYADQVRPGCLNNEWSEIALENRQVMNACLDYVRADSLATDL